MRAMKLIPAIALTLALAQASETEPNEDGTIYQFTVDDAGGNPVDFGERYKDKVVVIVNTATGLAGGLTEPNIAQLQALYTRLGGETFAVAAFPSDTFGGEPLTASDAQAYFEREFNATFDVYALTEVNGRNESALYTLLKAALGGEHGLSDIEYNYVKFVVDKQGKPAFRYPPYFAPSRLVEDVDFLMSDAFARYAEAKKQEDGQDESAAGDVRSLIESAPDAAAKPDVDIAAAGNGTADDDDATVGAEAVGNGTAAAANANATADAPAGDRWHLQPAEDEAPPPVDAPWHLQPADEAMNETADGGADAPMPLLNGTEIAAEPKSLPETAPAAAAPFNATDAAPPPPGGNATAVETMAEAVADAMAEAVAEATPPPPRNDTLPGDITVEMTTAANGTDIGEVVVGEDVL